MDYRLPHQTFNRKRCVLRCTAETIIRDIPIYTLVEGIKTFNAYKVNWQTFQTAISLELYEYGQLIMGWSKETGDYDMGKLNASYKEKSNFTDATMRQEMVKHATEFHITKIAESKSTISGKKQFVLSLLFGEELSYKDDGKTVRVPTGTERLISLDADDNRSDVFSPDGKHFIGNELPYGPCVLTQRGKYFRIDDVAGDEEDEMMEEDESLP